MRLRLDSSLACDSGWATPPATASRTLIAGAGGAELRHAASLIRRWDDPLAALDWLDGERRRGGRWVGFLGYELGRLLEPAVGGAPRCQAGDVPLFAWGWVPGCHSFSRRGSCVVESPDTASPSGEAVAPGKEAVAPDPTSNFTRREYLAAVRRCLEFIAAGDVFQVNLAQRLEMPFAGSADALYEALLATAPAAYGAMLDFDDFAVISNSPELFLRASADGRIVTRPIKGTRPNGPVLAHMADELRDSPKDVAELNMIVDLERNDLGRICEIGSVRVSQPRTIEAHPTVFHGVAEVEGRLRADVGLVELLRATFPGGSVTGAPKIRAMQIIDELEPVPRGVYCGAIGHFDADGSLQLNLAIRTMTLNKLRRILHIPVGGGIVAESDPEAEYEETWVKARAALEAVALTCR